MKFVEKLFRRHRIYTGKSVSFSADTISLPDGKKALREYLEHPGAVAVLPLLPDREHAIFVKQYRYPVRSVTLEIPAGKIDSKKKESPLTCVQRELEEETGYRASKITKMISYWPTPAFGTEVLHVYLAEGLTRGRYAPDADEFVKPCVIKITRALDMARRGIIKDSKTLIALFYYSFFIVGKKHKI